MNMDIYEALFLAREKRLDYFRGKVDAMITYGRIDIYNFKDLFENLCVIPDINKRIAKIKHLISHDFNINCTFSERKNALFLKTDKETTSYLLYKGIDINHLNSKWQNALFECKEKDDIPKIKLLISSGIDLYKEDRDRKNILFTDCDYEVLQFYLSLGLDPNHEDYDGNTPIFYFEEEDNLDLLIDSKANIYHRNKRGQTAILYVLETDYWSAKYYFDKGFNLSIKDNEGKGIVDYIRKLPESDLKYEYLKKVSFIERNNIVEMLDIHKKETRVRKRI